MFAIMKSVRAKRTCPCWGKNKSAVAVTQTKVLTNMIRFLEPQLSAIAPKIGEHKATIIDVKEIAHDQYCVPKISLSAIDLVKKVPYMKVTTKVVKAELAKSYIAQDHICRLSSFFIIFRKYNYLL